MENIKLPAYPLPLVSNAEGEVKDASDWEGLNVGFTKLELASLMIAQGMLANSPDWSENEKSINWVGVNSVKYAKAVLEEANK